MDEFSFIKSIKQHYYKQSTLVKGIGDDAAVFRQPSKDIVTAVDTFVENVHFSRKTMSPFSVGYRALAVNISDLAAMGAVPSFYLVSIVIPTSWHEDDLMAIYAGMKKIADTYQMDLIGGDTVSGKELSISITVIGYTAKGKSRYRSHAQDDDIIFVTGTLGDSEAGLHVLLNKESYKDENYFIKRHQFPSPRVSFACGLERLSRVALNDISDGIANEAAEIAEFSKVNITLYDDLIPVSPLFNQFPISQQNKWKLFGGEDFELIGAVSSGDWLEVKNIAEENHTQVTKIGYAEYNSVNYGQVFLFKNGCKRHLSKNGFTHF